MREATWTGRFVVAFALCGFGSHAKAEKPPLDCCTNDPNSAQANSVLYLAYQAWLNRRPAPLLAPRLTESDSDTLEEYARKCDEATGIHVPAFDCDAGDEVPGQGFYDTRRRIAPAFCDAPNVLNHACDPGSRFQVLPGGTIDAVAVAHCRKVGLAPRQNDYNDIAVIQYNKSNGALCFYQALGNNPLPPADPQYLSPRAPEPSSYGDAPWSGRSVGWLKPAATHGIGCVGCHDNGGFIRSEYIAQMRTPPNELPSTSSGFNNLNIPVHYVGRDFANDKTWSITTAQPENDTGLPCTTCHRLGVSNKLVGYPATLHGTAASFAGIATASTQASKNPHGPASPIWMRPGQIVYDAWAEQSALRFQNCATSFFHGGFNPVPGCTFTPLGDAWTGIDAARFVSQTPVPTSALPASSTFKSAVAFSNSGQQPWTGNRTMSIAPSQNGVPIFPPQSFPLGAMSPVRPGDTVFSNFTVILPANPGTYDLAFIVTAANGAVLGASPTQQVVVQTVGQPVDNAFMQIAVAPTSLPSGAVAPVMVNAINTGSTTWTPTAYGLGVSRGLRVSLPKPLGPLGTTIPPGVLKTFTFDVACNGSGQGWFEVQMRGPMGAAFGQSARQTIVCQ